MTDLAVPQLRGAADCYLTIGEIRIFSLLRCDFYLIFFSTGNQANLKMSVGGTEKFYTRLFQIET